MTIKTPPAYRSSAPGRGALLLLLLAALFCPARQGAAFQPLIPYPAYDSVILHPYDPADASARLLEMMQPFYYKISGRNFTVQEKPGRSGASAWSYLGSFADGYSLSLTDLPNLALLSLRQYPAFDLEELRSVCLLASMPLMLWVPAESKYKNFYDLVEQAKAQPGQIVIAGQGSGTIQHLAALRLDRLAGMKTLFLPYSGDSSARQAAVSGRALAFWGHSDPGLAGLGLSSLDGTGVGQTCRPLAVAAMRRHPLFPDTPTFVELGYDLVETSHFGLALSANTEAKTVQAVRSAFLNLAREAEFQAQITRYGFIPAPVGAFELHTYLRGLLEYYAVQRTDYGLQ